MSGITGEMWAAARERVNHVAQLHDLQGRVTTLEATIERLDAERKIMIRSTQTALRHTRLVLAEKRTLMALLKIASPEISL